MKFMQSTVKAIGLYILFR